MNWTKEEVRTLIEMIDQGCTECEITQKIKKSRDGIRSKAKNIINRRKLMADLNITNDNLMAVIVQCKGSQKHVAAHFNVTHQAISGLIKNHPDVHDVLDQTINKNRLYLRNLINQSNYARIQKWKKLTDNQTKKLKIMEFSVQKNLPPFEQAKRKLGNRITYHEKLGTMLDGKPMSIQKIIAATMDKDRGGELEGRFY